jgi:hypothetical protein
MDDQREGGNRDMLTCHICGRRVWDFDGDVSPPSDLGPCERAGQVENGVCQAAVLARGGREYQLEDYGDDY